MRRSLGQPTLDLNTIQSKPRLPFIIIPKFNLKILIDSGASNSIINPGPVSNYFSNFQFKKKFEVTSLKQKVTNDTCIKYPILEDFNINYSFECLVMEWHDHFDALIGNNDFKKLKALIDYRNSFLCIENKRIPFYLELNSNNC